MSEVYLTVDQAAAAVGLSRVTVLRQCGRNRDGTPRRFPNAKLRHGSRKFGYRIPSSDILAYAMSEGEDVVEQARQVITEVTAEQATKKGEPAA